jgi:hypothetical protein
MELPQAPRCIHLQSKTLAVHGEAYVRDPGDEAGMTDCWCVKTARALGPDDGLVSLKDCSDPARDCYQEY